MSAESLSTWPGLLEYAKNNKVQEPFLHYLGVISTMNEFSVYRHYTQPPFEGNYVVPGMAATYDYTYELLTGLSSEEKTHKHRNIWARLREASGVLACESGAHISVIFSEEALRPSDIIHPETLRTQLQYMVEVVERTEGSVNFRTIANENADPGLTQFTLYVRDESSDSQGFLSVSGSRWPTHESPRLVPDFEKAWMEVSALANGIDQSVNQMQDAIRNLS